MTLLEQMQRAQEFDAANFLAIEIGGRRAGWIRRDACELLRRWPETFEHREGAVRIAESLANESMRSGAFARVARALESDGVIRGWRSETYAVRIKPGDVPLLHIERAAMRFFGFRSAAAHLNGYVRDADGLRVWIARRSAAKSVDPGFLDTLVGGGIPSGQDAAQTLLRECSEEAGMERALAERARAVATLEVCHEVPEGLHREILYAHDLELPADFRPRSVDGEVGEFMLLGAAETADRIAGGEFTVEAGLVTLDFLLRRAAIGPDPALGAALDRCRLRP